MNLTKAYPLQLSLISYAEYEPCRIHSFGFGIFWHLAPARRSAFNLIVKSIHFYFYCCKLDNICQCCSNCSLLNFVKELDPKLQKSTNSSFYFHSLILLVFCFAYLNDLDAFHYSLVVSLFLCICTLLVVSKN